MPILKMSKTDILSIETIETIGSIGVIDSIGSAKEQNRAKLFGVFSYFGLKFYLVGTINFNWLSAYCVSTALYQHLT